MNIDESVFAVKLYEMEEQYGKLQCRIRICEQGGQDKIHSELEKAEDEYKENALLLEEKARVSRSPAVTRLMQVQLDYSNKISEAMKKQVAEDLHSEDTTPEQDEREADMLYAEFAMDAATLAMQQALIAVLTALDKGERLENRQPGCGEETEITRRNRYE